MSFGSALFLLPIATALHVRDEWPGFPRWARRFASPRYTDREYASVHKLAIAISAATPLLFWLFPSRATALLAVTLVIGPNLIWNAVFHIGATIVSRQACPGVITGALIYLPFGSLLIVLAVRESLLSPGAMCASVAFAALWHASEVSHNVFKRWWLPSEHPARNCKTRRLRSGGE